MDENIYIFISEWHQGRKFCEAAEKIATHVITVEVHGIVDYICAAHLRIKKKDFAFLSLKYDTMLNVIHREGWIFNNVKEIIEYYYTPQYKELLSKMDHSLVSRTYIK